MCGMGGTEQQWASPSGSVTGQSLSLVRAWSAAKEHVLAGLVDPWAVLVRTGPEVVVVWTCWAGMALPETREILSSWLLLLDAFMKGL